jgi:hypothetical protein
MALVNSIRLYVINNYPPSERTVEQWADGAKRRAQSTFEKTKEKVPNYQEYVDKIADPASFSYKDVINPAYVSRGGKSARKIRNAHRSNLMRGYEKYNLNREYAYETIDGEPAKRYTDKIDQAKDTYSTGMAERTLRFTGDKITGLGISPRAARWLTGQNIQVRATYDSINGSPINVVMPELLPQLKAALVPRLTQSGIAVVQSEMDPDIIGDENTLINKLVSSMRLPAFAEFVEPFDDLKSHCGYIVEDGQLYLRIQVAAV